MACWSTENATNAYLKTLRMGQSAKEPDVAEFISAIAAGNNAQLMVVASATTVNTTTLAGLVAAAIQTCGRVICVHPGHEGLESSRQALGFNANHVEFVIGDAQSLLLTHYSEADFVLIDCNLENHEGILRSVRSGKKRNGAVVVGYNAFTNGSWWSGGLKTQLLPIGEGLLLTRVPPYSKIGSACGYGRRSRWIVKVDKCTGEEHVFRVRLPQGKHVET